MTTLTDDRCHVFTDVSFAGVPCAQYFIDFYVWEGVLNDRTRTGPVGVPPIQSIVELGTYKGGFSLYLAAQAHARNLGFSTYDVVAPERQIPGFVQLDVFAEADRIRAELARQEPVLLFCDGGNKPRELREFGTALGPDSCVAVHDWGTEITDTDVPDSLEMVYGDYCQGLGSITRFFQRRRDG